MGSLPPAVQGLIKGGKLILDDGSRVSKVCDRGESARHKKQRLIQQDPWANGTSRRVDEPRYERNLVEDIAAELDEAKNTCPLEPEKRFIPHPLFVRILTFDRVRKIIYNLRCFNSNRDKDELAREIYYGSRDGTRAPCVKLLAVLIGVDKAEDMAEHMFVDGMKDTCLPLQKEAVDGLQYLHCREHGRHSTINSYRRPEVRERFERWSYTLSAPYITREGSHHSHYILGTGDVFPMEVISKVEQDEHTESTAKGSQGDENTYGGFSEVYKVKIYEGHFDFGDHGVRRPLGLNVLCD